LDKLIGMCYIEIYNYEAVSLILYQESLTVVFSTNCNNLERDQM